MGEPPASASQSIVKRELVVDTGACPAWSEFLEFPVLFFLFRGGEFGLNSKSSSQFSGGANDAWMRESWLQSRAGRTCSGHRAI